MIEKGDTIAAGVSGGADSVCLLFVLLKIREKIPFQLIVVHVNHGIREDAARDAAYVQRLCEENNIPFYLTKTQVKEYASRCGLSEEEAGRKVRYEAFEEALLKEQEKAEDKRPGEFAGKIAVAHNSNDRAETMLFHLFRGTGLTGLSGIKPVNGKVIRPLLCLGRGEIEEWLAGQGISYCTDSTNEQDIYTRNKIRHHILPFAEENICTGAVSHMNRAADDLALAEEFIRKQTLFARERCVSAVQNENGQEIRINLPEFFSEDPYLQGRILLSCLEDITEGRKDITSVHIDNMKRLFAGNGSGEIHLPYGITVYRKYDVGMIVKGGISGKQELPKEKRYTFEGNSFPAVLWIPELGNVEITVFSHEKTENIPQKTYTKWFDYDKITTSIVFRVREKGDYLTINSKMDRKSLQDYFVNEKIPKEERDSFYVLADGAHILWVPGHRISEYYKVSENTRRILQVRITKEDIEERSHE
ncbi:MAG: tRNA lysidine(34) synthetase TilS [Suilimivivens sp.]